MLKFIGLFHCIMRKLPRFSFRLVLLICFSIFANAPYLAQASSYQDGIAAYQAKDFPMARAYFEKSAKRNNLSAIFNLGIMLAKGIGGETDLARSVKLLTHASEAGLAAAQHNLALAYFTGNGTKKDLERARIWWERAARQEHILAQYNLGALLWNGTGVLKKPDAAIKWFRSAAKAGNQEAKAFLQTILSEQQSELRADKVDSSDPLLADENVAQLLTLASDAFRQQDYENARKLWEQAAEHGSGSALYQLAGLYQNGTGVEKNPRTAFNYIEQSAKKGQANAQFQLANFLLTGEFVDKNPTLALFWMQSAADKNHLKAKDYLEQQR